MTTTATNSGTFKIGGEIEVHRLGYGAMQITGEGIWGEPDDREGCLDVLRKLPELGVDFIDTADSYGPFVSEDLIREALHPYDEVTVATKGGLTRSGPNDWRPVGKPDYLRQCALMSMRRLDVETIDLYQLHRIDSDTPAEEQFGLLKDLKDEGKIRHIGLSEVSVDEIKQAQETIDVATVQNIYNLTNRDHEDVVDYCTENGIGFIPWFPLNSGALAEEGGPVDEAAKAHEAAPSQIALAWLLQRSEVMLPIAGTSSVEHLKENIAAAEVELTDEEMEKLNRAADED